MESVPGKPPTSEGVILRRGSYGQDEPGRNTGGVGLAVGDEPFFLSAPKGGVVSEEFSERFLDGAGRGGK